jgi:hypothetical protein
MRIEDLEGEADRLLAATIYLMSCHARSRCPRLAAMVGMHLRLLGRHPELGDRVRDSCQKLCAAWEAIRRHDEVVLAAVAPEPGPPLH